jgi:glyoxylase-like metal-dependent hydrolase (beta-lactamase superfamily II)
MLDMSAKDVNQENIIVPNRWWESLPRTIYKSLERVETSQPWFEVYKIEPNIYAIYEPYQFEETISYLILGKERAALVDTGDGIANIKICVEELTKLPIFVLNTHNHTDHVAQNYMFKEVWSYDGPTAHEASKTGYPQKKMVEMVGPGMTWKPLPKTFDPKKYVAPPWKITKWLHDGDVVDLGGRKLEVLYTPGHSNDSLCLLDKKARMLWVGDIFYTGGIYTYLAGGDLDQFIASYEKMIKISSQYDYLMPSHNEPLVDKNILRIVLEKAKAIRAGTEKNYRESVDKDRIIRRYQYDRFAIVCAIDQIKA